MTKNRTLVFILAFLVIAGCSGDNGEKTASSGSEEAKRPRVAFVTNGVADFWVIAKKGAEAGGKEYGSDVSVHMPPAGLSDQQRILEDLLVKGVDGIAVSPIDPTNQTEFLDKVAARTDLITHDSDAPDSDRLVYIGMDNYDAGRMCGRLVKETLPDGGKVFIFIGRLEQDNARRRRQGVIDELLDRDSDPSRYDPPGATLEGEKYVVLGTLTDQFDLAKGKANAEDALSRHPDVDAMVGLFAYNPPLILEALKGANRLGEIKVIAFDEDDQTLQGIKDGTVSGTVVQNPYEYGRQSVKVLAALANGDRSVIPEDGMINIPARTITSKDVDAFWADLRKKTGKDGDENKG
jgi:ribose transport system substrate-binding protein